MTFIILSTMKKTQRDDRSPETEVINRSQVGVFTGKYLLYFYYFNKNQKPRFGSCWTPALLTKCCYSISLLKKLLVPFFFIDITKTTHTVSGGRAGVKACMLGSKRENQREGTTWLPQSSTYPKSGSVWTGLLHQTQNSQNSFYSIHKGLNMISLQSQT